jgi:hypothetical protein
LWVVISLRKAIDHHLYEIDYSGERARLACSVARLAQRSLKNKKLFDEAPKTARAGACAPLKIAQRFNAGYMLPQLLRVPPGTKETPNL